MNSLFELIPDEPAPSPAVKARRKARKGAGPLGRQSHVDRWLQGRSLALQKVAGMSPSDADRKALADWLRIEAEEGDAGCDRRS